MSFLNLEEVEEAARRVMDKQAWDYYAGGTIRWQRREHTTAIWGPHCHATWAQELKACTPCEPIAPPTAS
jgi:hypothetical protein